jgi:hypothetical protein
MDGVSKPLRSATYLLRFTPEEKQELEQKVRRAAAEGHAPLTLAQALRMGAKKTLDDILAGRVKLEDVTEDAPHEQRRAA